MKYIWLFWYTALAQVANVVAADARTLTVTPWEKAMLQPLKKRL
jgi:ribosome recycling factor